MLVCGAHPDDEVAMAGTIAKLSGSGVQVFVLIFTDGCEGYPEPGLRERVRREQDACDRILGVHRRMAGYGLGERQGYFECLRIIREIRPTVPTTGTGTTGP